MNNNAQDYEVTNFKVGNYIDKFGNTWCNLAVKSFAEPITIVLKDPTSVTVGQTLYGRIEAAKNSKGNDYWRFRKEQKEEAHSTPQSESKSSSWQESPEKQRSINKSVALNNAVLYVSDTNQLTPEEVLKVADRFLQWLDPKQVDKENITEVMGEPNEEPITLDDIPF